MCMNRETGTVRANVSQCFVTGIVENWRFGNGQTGIIYGIDPIAISVIMYIMRLRGDGIVDLERRKRPPRSRSVYYITIIIVYKYNSYYLARRGTCSATAGNRKTETPVA